MKKITFILFALITGTTFAQSKANAIAAVNAEIVSPLGIASSGALNFGTFTTSEESVTATITILADGSEKTFSETDMELPGDVFSNPTFTITKSENVQYGLDLAVSEAPTDGTNSLSLNALTSTASAENNDITSFTVGGTLNVPSDAVEGIYEGEVKVTVTYE
jgi:spore coat protein U-like protein